MISLWTRVTESDVEAYAATLVLPSYLSHLRMAPFQFALQDANSDGAEPLVVTYLGQGRLEEYLLRAEDHALPLIRSVCPEIDPSHVQLPRDDAHWCWAGMNGESPSMRVYFSPTASALNGKGRSAEPSEAYVSVTRGHLFIGADLVREYLEAWLTRLGVRRPIDPFQLVTSSGGVSFAAGPVEGELFLDAAVVIEDLLRFTGLDATLAEVGELARLDLDQCAAGSGVREDGLYLALEVE